MNDTANLPALIDTFELDQRRATAYAKSGYWKDATDVAKALVKIEAGRSLGLPPLIAMNEVHVIDGKPQIGAGGLAAMVKQHPKYDYRIVELTNQGCAIEFVNTRSGEIMGLSVFTEADAKQAELPTKNPSYKKYPRNMLFARAMSNGVAWFCPDVVGGRIYTEGELDDQPPPPAPAVNVEANEADDIDWPDPADEYEAATVPVSEEFPLPEAVRRYREQQAEQANQ